MSEPCCSLLDPNPGDVWFLMELDTLPHGLHGESLTPMLGVPDSN